jgi:predicted HTH transcriptional regulator
MKKKNHILPPSKDFNNHSEELETLLAKLGTIDDNGSGLRRRINEIKREQAEENAYKKATCQVAHKLGLSQELVYNAYKKDKYSLSKEFSKTNKDYRPAVAHAVLASGYGSAFLVFSSLNAFQGNMKASMFLFLAGSFSSIVGMFSAKLAFKTATSNKKAKLNIIEHVKTSQKQLPSPSNKIQ